nr:putative reverse transcriptase domain-containing protein [Tanacetum cinerariifolium]
MFAVLSSSVSFVASCSFSTTGGGIGGPSYEIPLWVVVALASFLGFGMRFVGDQKNERVNKTEEDHSYSLSNRSLDFVNISLWIYSRLFPRILESSHRSHGHHNDRHGSDRRGGSDNHGSSNHNYSGSNNRHPGECRRAAGTCFKCGQAGHLQKDCKKNTTASTSGQADKKPGASGRVFAITEGHAANTSGTITGTLFIYEHAVFVLFDTGATHSVISSAFASRVTTTPMLLDHVLCISTPMQDSVRITHVYRNLPIQFDDKIRAINALPLDMCEFDIILGMDWLTEHHATI